MHNHYASLIPDQNTELVERSMSTITAHTRDDQHPLSGSHDVARSSTSHPNRNPPSVGSGRNKDARPPKPSLAHDMNPGAARLRNRATQYNLSSPSTWRMKINGDLQAPPDARVMSRVPSSAFAVSGLGNPTPLSDCRARHPSFASCHVGARDGSW